MSSIIGSFFSGTSGQDADKTIAYSSSGAATASAQAYFSAALAATTPEVRALFSGYCTQCLTGQETIMNYMIQKNWANPYEQPDDQLARVVSESTISNTTTH